MVEGSGVRGTNGREWRWRRRIEVLAVLGEEGSFSS